MSSLSGYFSAVCSKPKWNCHFHEYSSLPLSLTYNIKVWDEIPVEENDKRLQVLIMPEKGREAGLTLFTDTLCELTTLHILFRVI